MKIKTSEKLYYIQDARSTVGNCVSWWRSNSCGYTIKIDEAGLYSEEEAFRINRNRKTDIPWLKEIVDKCIVRHVCLDDLHKLFIPLDKLIHEM